MDLRAVLGPRLGLAQYTARPTENASAVADRLSLLETGYNSGVLAPPHTPFLRQFRLAVVGFVVLGMVVTLLHRFLRPSEVERVTKFVTAVSGQLATILSSTSPADAELDRLLQNLANPMVVVEPEGGRTELSHQELKGLIGAAKRSSQVAIEPESLVATLDQNENRAEIAGDLVLRERLAQGAEHVEQRRIRLGLRRFAEGWKIASFEFTVPVVDQPEARP